MVDQNSKKYDFIGITLSVLCGIHCLVTPLFIIYLPKLGETLQSPWAHTVLIVLMTFAFYQSVFKHFKIHRSKKTLGLGLFGFTLILITYLNEILSHEHNHEHGHGHIESHGNETLMIALAIIGSVSLISSHILNIQNCKCLKETQTCSLKA